MKKLLLVPTILATAFLLFVFLLPATAAGVVRTVAPALHVVAASTVSAISGPGGITQTKGAGSISGSSSANRQAATQNGGDLSSSSALFVNSSSVGHSGSTTPRENCGRYGNGSHGGKHDFVCPNRPFPVPPNH
jgi:hypothetical protein